MTSQSRAANSNPKQLTLALDMTSPSPSSTESQRRRPRTRRGIVARVDLVIYAESVDEAAVQIQWRLTNEDKRPRVAPMQMCPECERGFRAPEPGLCRDCHEGANA